MMLNIKLTELKYEKLNYIPLLIIFSFVFVTEFFYLFCFSFDPLSSTATQQVFLLSDFTSLTPVSSNFIFYFVSLIDMRAIGQLLFVDFFFHFIISGFILLLAMVAAITSTLNKRFIAKSQTISAQVMRSFNNSVVNF